MGSLTFLLALLGDTDGVWQHNQSSDSDMGHVALPKDDHLSLFFLRKDPGVTQAANLHTCQMTDLGVFYQLPDTHSDPRKQCSAPISQMRRLRSRERERERGPRV